MTANEITIGLSAATLLTLLGIAWRGGSFARDLKAGQELLAKDVTSLRTDLNVMREDFKEHQREDVDLAKQGQERGRTYDRAFHHLDRRVGSLETKVGLPVGTTEV